jgi:hypothetical protein
MIGKAYSMIGMLSGGGIVPTLNKKPSPGGANTAKKETKPDYCMIAAMGFETFGALIQKSLQKNAENTTSPGDAQLQALISLKETHKARKVTAEFQIGLYGAVSACYLGMLFDPTLSIDVGYYLKMSGAAALTGLYAFKAIKHKNAAENVQRVIDSLEKAGKDCGPWTHSNCFCSEPTSKNLYPIQYEEVCILNKGNFNTPKVALGCASIDKNQLTFDKDCKCKQTNTCFKNPLLAYNPNLNIGANYIKEANRMLNLLGNGQYDQAELNRAGLSYASMVSRTKFPHKEKIKVPTLNSDQKKAADEFKKYMPEVIAQLAAVARPQDSSKIQDHSLSIPLSKLSPEIKQKIAEAISVEYKNGLGTAHFHDSKEEFSLPKSDEDNQSNKESTEILSFVDQAMVKAEVSNTPSTPIFDIISNRYRKSGWQKLDTTGK